MWVGVLFEPLPARMSQCRNLNNPRCGVFSPTALFQHCISLFASSECVFVGGGLAWGFLFAVGIFVLNCGAKIAMPCSAWSHACIRIRVGECVFEWVGGVVCANISPRRRRISGVMNYANCMQCSCATHRALTPEQPVHSASVLNHSALCSGYDMLDIAMRCKHSDEMYPIRGGALASLSVSVCAPKGK